MQLFETHPKVCISFDNITSSLNEWIDKYEFRGYISMDILHILFTIYSWDYVDGGLDNIKSKLKLDARFHEDLEGKVDKSHVLLTLLKMLKDLDYQSFKYGDIAESTLLLYVTLTRYVNIRELESGNIVAFKTGKGINKRLTLEDFFTKELFDDYIKLNYYEIPQDILKLNFIEVSKSSTDDTTFKTIKGWSDVTRTRSKADLVRPDFLHKALNRTLETLVDIDTSIKDDDKDIKKNELVVLQDCTASMADFNKKLKTVKALLINKAYKEGFIIRWVLIADTVYEETVMDSKESFNNALKALDYFAPIGLDIKNVLKRVDTDNKHIMIITDGTDNLNCSFDVGAKSVNVLSFKKNKVINELIQNYGRQYVI